MKSGSIVDFRTILIVPPSAYIPAVGYSAVASAPLEGATIAASLLRISGYEVDCYDLRHYPHKIDEINDRIRAREIHVLAIAGTPDSYSFVKDFSRTTKELNPGLSVVVGGPLATYSWQVLLSKTSVDYCAAGDCEHYIFSLWDAIRKRCDCNSNLVFDRQSYKGRTAASVRMDRYDLGAEIRAGDYLDYSVWFDEGKSRPFDLLCYSSQRGCKENCIFCANLPSKLRYRSVTQMLEDVTLLRQRFSTHELYLNDPTFNSNLQHVQEACKVFSELGIKWACTIRADNCSEEMFRTMKASGCTTVFIGVESFNNKILHKYKRNITLDQVERSLEYLEKVGLRTELFLVIGLPDETNESILETLHHVEKNYPKAHPRPKYAIPFPGSRLFHEYLQDLMTDLNRREQPASALDLEEEILEKIANTTYGVSDEPFLLPKNIDQEVLTMAMRRLNQIAEERNADA